MANSLYRDKEIFLRELISNASDACDKLRYSAITQPDLLGDDAALAVTITPDSDKSVLVVADNGIGMNRQELIDNLGTIARSGTEAFVKQMAESKAGDGQDEQSEQDGEDEQNGATAGLIGQFGVGFYSSFMVAKRVDVVTRRADGNRGLALALGRKRIVLHRAGGRRRPRHQDRAPPAQGRSGVPGAAPHPHRRQGLLRPCRPADLARKRERPEGNGQRGLGALEPAQERDRRGPVPRVLPPHRPHAGRPLAHHPTCTQKGESSTRRCSSYRTPSPSISSTRSASTGSGSTSGGSSSPTSARG